VSIRTNINYSRKLCRDCKALFYGYGKTKPTLVLALPIHVSISWFCLSYLEGHQKKLKFFTTCCSVSPLTCRIHHLWFLQRHIYNFVILVLIFIRTLSHATANHEVHAEGPVHSTKTSTKGICLIVQPATATPLSTWLRLSIQFK